MIKNRKILAALILAMAVPFTMTASAQQPKQIKVGTFKLIHMMAPVWWERFLEPAGTPRAAAGFGQQGVEAH